MTLDPALIQARDALVTAEREARRWHDELAEHAERDRGAILALVRHTLADTGNDPDDAVPLVCMARLLGELEGDDVVDALIDILDRDLPEARAEAGEQLQGLAFDRFKEVAMGVERALGRLGEGSVALVELPFVLAEVGEGGVSHLLTKFLSHPDADVVGASIEALALVGDPSTIGALEALQRDPRTTSLEEDGVTVGELAEDAVGLLRAMQEGADG